MCFYVNFKKLNCGRYTHKAYFFMEISTLLSICPQWNDYTIKIKFVKVVPIEIVTFHMTNGCSSSLLASIQDSQIGRFGMSSLQVSEQQLGFCLCYFAFLSKHNLQVVLPFPLLYSSFEHMRFLLFPSKQQVFEFLQKPSIFRVSHYQVLSEQEVSRSVAVFRSPPTVIQ